MRFATRLLAAVSVLALLNASTPAPAFAQTTPPPPPLLRPVPPDRWPLFKDGSDKSSLIKAATRSLEYLRTMAVESPFYHTIDRDMPTNDLAASVEEFIRAVKEAKSDEELNARLRRDFDLYESAGSDGSGKVVFSSYAVPVVPASLKRSAEFKYPLYSWPPDLIVGDLGPFDPKLVGRTILGRVTPDKKFVPYYSRHDIDAGRALAGKGLEVAWLTNGFDRLVAQIQGSAILQMENGHRVLARHTITNGLKYRSVGSALIDAGVLTKKEFSYERLRRYMKEHPEKESWAIDLNPRYVFFELVPVPSDGETFGRIQSSWITPLTAGRSVAVDPGVFPLGSVAYYDVALPEMAQDGRVSRVSTVSRFAFPQDTGGAILGPGRVDLYAGAGAQAMLAATHPLANGKFFIFFKKVKK